MTNEWCDPRDTDSLLDSLIIPLARNLSNALSREIFSTSSDNLILIRSPLSGLAKSFSCLITRRVSPTILSPFLIILRSVIRSSESSGMSEITLSSIILEIIISIFNYNKKNLSLLVLLFSNVVFYPIKSNYPTLCQIYKRI